MRRFYPNPFVQVRSSPFLYTQKIIYTISREIYIKSICKCKASWNFGNWKKNWSKCNERATGPSRAAGMDSTWIGVGIVQPNFSQASTNSSHIPKFLNVVVVVVVTASFSSSVAAMLSRCRICASKQKQQRINISWSCRCVAREVGIYEIRPLGFFVFLVSVFASVAWGFKPTNNMEIILCLLTILPLIIYSFSLILLFIFIFQIQREVIFFVSKKKIKKKM